MTWGDVKILGPDVQAFSGGYLWGLFLQMPAS